MRLNWYREMNDNLISVIVPNYNHSKFLRQRLDSVLTQSYQKIEIIILDDCSTDDSKKIIEDYRQYNEVSHIIYNSSNSGNTFCQWKKGIELAIGDFIWIAESDDLADPSFLENCMKVFEKNSTVGIVYSQSLSINENGDNGESWFSHTKSLDSCLWCNDFYMNGFDFSQKYMLFQNSIPNASAVVFKRLLCLESGKINTSYKINGDWDLYTRILALSDIGFISQNLNFFRQHNKNGSIVNVKNGNNISEYYKLLKNWKIIFKLESSLYSIISQHIFNVWNEQYQKSLMKVLRHNFFKIFKSALNADKFIFKRFFRAYL